MTSSGFFLFLVNVLVPKDDDFNLHKPAYFINNRS